MKILLVCPLPFALAHGGHQIQVEQTMAALRGIGLEAEPLRWWDAGQKADLVHYVGRMPAEQIRLAHQKGVRVVMGELLTATGSRSPARLRLQKFASRAVARLMPGDHVAAFNWDSYRLADACVALTSWEAHLMSYLFGAPPERVHVVPNGVEEIFFNPAPSARGPWLVCTATLAARKRVVELATAAVRARTPVWIIGRAYAESDPCAQQISALARQHPDFVRCTGVVQDRAELARIYREARGFVLLSAWESLSLSALEAAACECPLLLSDLPWAHAAFGDAVKYCPVTDSVETTAKTLRGFYDAAPGLKPPPRPMTWQEVALRLKSVYEQVL